LIAKNAAAAILNPLLFQVVQASLLFRPLAAGGIAMSSAATFFLQNCPVCGGPLRVSVRYLGKQIQCRRCHAVFAACDQESNTGLAAQNTALLLRVEELLAVPTPAEQPVA
jgi:hypothetical protein